MMDRTEDAEADGSVEDDPVDVSIDEQHAVHVGPRHQQQQALKHPDSPLKQHRKYNQIEDYIHGADCSELLRGCFKTNAQSDRQPASPSPHSNFEFCDVVFVASREQVDRMRKKTDVREIKTGRGHKKSAIRFGVFMAEPLDPGVFIDLFIGHYHLLSTLVEKANGRLLQPCNQPFVLVPETPPGLAVDARRSGNELRFIRRSCRPNVTVKPIIVDSGPNDKSLLIGIFSMNGLKTGEELFAPLDGLPLLKYDCSCGTGDLCLAPIELVPETALKAHDSKDHLDDFYSERSTSTSSRHQALPAKHLQSQQNDRKMSREERKLQRYIEFFEKMDAIDSQKQQQQHKATSRKKSSAGKEHDQAVKAPPSPRKHQQQSSPSDSASSSPKHLKKQWLHSTSHHHHQGIAAPTPMTPADSSLNDLIVVDIVASSSSSSSSAATLSDVHSSGKPIQDDSRVTPLSQIINAEGTAIPGDGDTPTRKRLSLNDYLEKRRKAVSPLGTAVVSPGSAPVQEETPPSAGQADEEEGQIVE